MLVSAVALAVVSACFAQLADVPKQLDADASLQGHSIDAALQAAVPHARHEGDLAEVLWLTPMSLSLGGGGMDLLDAPALSLHGASWTQTQYRWGQLDITDPARPGTPLFRLPPAAMQRLQLHALDTPQPVLQWHTPSASEPMPQRFWVAGGGGAAVGGGVWLPRNLFDREPAFAFGAPQARRRMHSAQEASLGLALPWRKGGMWLHAEHIVHARCYLGSAQPNISQRDTLLLSVAQQLGLWRSEVRLAYQHHAIQGYGAGFALPAAWQQQQQQYAWLLQVQLQRDFTPWAHLLLSLGLAHKYDQETPQQRGAHDEDLLAATLWLQQPRLAEDLRRSQAEAVAELTVARNPARRWLKLRASVLAAGWRGRSVADQGPIQTSFAGAPVGTAQVIGDSHVRTALERWRTDAQGRLNLRPGAQAPHVLLGFGIDGSFVYGASGRLFAHTAPSWRAALVWPLGRWQLFALLRQDREALTAQAADFLSERGARVARTSATQSDSDAVPSLGVSPAGHVQAAHLSRPVHTRLALGAGLRLFGQWWFGVRGTAHVLQRRYTVQRPAAAGDAVRAFFDPGGDGRGEHRLPGGGQLLQTAVQGAQADSPAASRPYVLTHDDKSSHYLGAELELVSPPARRWFVAVTGAAYLSAGRAPFGNYGDRNDPGIVSEQSAGTNNALHAWGRYDHDRSFALKALLGLVPIRGLQLSLAGRYRDGQPFARMVVDAEGRDAPALVMATGRGGARNTFRMSWDARVAYSLGKGAPLRVSVDVYNLFGSATELSEDVRTGPSFRRASEAVPPRSVFVNAQLSL